MSVIAGSHPNKVAEVDTPGEDTEAVTGLGAPFLGENLRVVRLGFVSAHFRWHSVGRLTIGLLERLCTSRGLQVFVIDASSGGRHRSTAGKPTTTTVQDTSRGQPDEDFVLERLAAAGASIVRIQAAAAPSPRNGVDATSPTQLAPTTKVEGSSGSGSGGAGSDALQTAREAIAALRLDVLVYADVGMDAFTTGLAHGRLSPVQVAFWGHPGTTGLSTMDYFVTSDLFEGDLGAGWGNRRRLRSDDGGASSADDDTRYVEHREEAGRNPDDVGDEATAAGGEGDGPKAWAGAERHDRQHAFSEQLVRLGGLGFIFDDPALTFGWDSAGEDSGNVPGRNGPSGDSWNGSRNGKHDRGIEDRKRRHSENSLPSSCGGDGRAASSPEEMEKRETEEANRPRLYVCAQSLMKMHPAFDGVLAGILAADPLAQILLLRDSRQLLWHSRFRRRLRAAIDAAEQSANFAAVSTCAAAAQNGTGPASSPIRGGLWGRVRFVSPLSGREFFRLQCRADVVLDPFPFGGGVTTLEVSCPTIVGVGWRGRGGGYSFDVCRTVARSRLMTHSGSLCLIHKHYFRCAWWAR